MTLKRSLLFCGTLLLFLVVSGSCEEDDGALLGQDENLIVEIAPTPTVDIEQEHLHQAGEEAILRIQQEHNDACPCILRSECPRVYGDNPLDFTELGPVVPCTETDFVRCCGVSVSVVQKADESPGVPDDGEEDMSTWEQHEFSSEEPSPVEEETEGEGDGDIEEKGEEERHDEEGLDMDDMMTSESRQDYQTVEPPLYRIQRKFQRLRHPSTALSEEAGQPGQNSGSEANLGSSPGGKEQISAQGEKGYHRNRIGNQIPPSGGDGSNGAESGDGQQQPPRYGARRRRPINRMRNRNGERGEEGTGGNGATSAPPHVPLVESSAKDEVESGRRPMSRLGGRVNVLGKGRKRLGSSSGEESSGASISASNNNKEDRGEATGSAGGSGQPDQTGNKLLENSPTGKLMPLRPKIRPFSRKAGKQEVGQSETEVKGSGEETANDSNKNSNGGDEGQPEKTELPNVVSMRKIPMRRVKPVVEQEEPVSENGKDGASGEEVTTPVKGRPIIMRRPSNLLLKSENGRDGDSGGAEGQGNAQNGLETIQQTSTEEQSTPIKVEKLNVRERLRGRHRNNPARGWSAPPNTNLETISESPLATAPQPEKIDGGEGQNPIDLAASGPPQGVIRKRLRPLRRPVSTQTLPTEPEQASIPTAAASEEVPISQVATGDFRRVKIRKGMNRFPFQKATADSQHNEEEKQPQQENISIQSPPAASSSQESGQSQGNLLRARFRRPRPSNVGSPGKEEAKSDDTPPATSETPVTVTSTYSRIRSNTRNGIPARPYFRRPSKPEVETVPEVSSPPPPQPPQPSQPDPSPVTPILDTRATSPFQIRNRFGAPSRRFQKPEESPVPEPVKSVELEAAGNDGQPGNPGGEVEATPEVRPKRGHWKRVRVRVKPTQEPTPEVPTPEQIDESLRNGEQHTEQRPLHHQQTEHLPPPQIFQDTAQAGEPGRSPDIIHHSRHREDVHPVPEPNPVPAQVITSDQINPALSSISPESTPSYLDAEDIKYPPASDYTPINIADDVYAPPERVTPENPHYPTTGEAGGTGEGDPYDLILNKDVRKTLGTQYTHLSHFTHDPVMDEPYKTGGDGGGGDEYSHIPVNPENKNGELKDDDGMGSIETLELGTPGYDPYPTNGDYNDWGNYDDDRYPEEEEEESRVHEKVHEKVPTKKSRFSAQSLTGAGKRNEGRRVTVVPKTAENLGAVRSPVNPVPSSTFSPVPEREPIPSYQPEKKDVNKRIRMQMRRPPSAYINSSGESGTFTPSIPSPRPTYSGNEQLIESVNESVQSIPKLEGSAAPYPSSKPLEEFIQSKQSPTTAPQKNRSRHRVKLVTFPTTATPTTPAPLPSYEDSYVEEKPSYSKFTFPPFKKSELAVISSTTAPPVVEVYAAPAPQTIYKPEPTPTTPPVRIATRPVKDIYSDGVPAAGAIKESALGASKQGPRFKVSELTPYTPVTPSVEHLETTRKPQVRLRAPAPHYSPQTSTTAAPIRHFLPPPTSAPTYSVVTPSPPVREVTEVYHHQPAPAAHLENEVNVVNVIRIEAPRPTQTQLIEEEQYGRVTTPQKAAAVMDRNPPSRGIYEDNSGGSQYAPSPVKETTPVLYAQPPVVISAPIKNYGKAPVVASPPPKVRQSNRFKVPEKFETPEFSEEDYGNGEEMLSVPPVITHHSPPVELDYEKDKRINVIDTETKVKVSIPPQIYDDDVFTVRVEQRPAPVPPPQLRPNPIRRPVELSSPPINPLPAPTPAPVKIYYEPEVVYPVKSPELPLQKKEKIVYQHAPAKVEEELIVRRPQKEVIVPDIRVNVVTPAPVPLHQNKEVVDYSGPPSQDYYHAVREPERTPLIPPAPPQYQKTPALPEVLKNSPFGPFPSTDHWSGIPSANSPKLPEFFEQKRHTTPPPLYTSPPPPSVYTPPLSPLPPPHLPAPIPSEYRPDIRVPVQEPRPLVTYPEKVILNGDAYHKEAPQLQPLLQPPSQPQPPLTTTVIKFGTDFDREEKREEYRRPHIVPKNPEPAPFFKVVEEVNKPAQPIQLPLQPPPQPAPYHNGHPPPAPTAPVALPPPQPNPSTNVEYEVVRAPHTNAEPPPHHPVRFQSSGQLQQQAKPVPPYHHEEQVIEVAPQVHHSPQHPIHSPTPPPPMKTLSYEIKDGEVVTHPHFIPQKGDLPQKEVRHPPQYTPQGHGRVVFPERDLPPREHHQVMHHSIPRDPPQSPPHPIPPFHTNSYETPALQNNPALAENNLKDTPKIVVNTNYENSAEVKPQRPSGNVIFEKEPEAKPAVSPALQGHGLDGQTPPRPAQSGHVKFPEPISQGFGSDLLNPAAPRPGFYGPPPPSQQKLPHYVPFGLGQDKPPRSNGDKQPFELHSRPNLHPHSPQHQSAFKQPAGFGLNPSYPPFPHSHRLNPSGGKFGNPGNPHLSNQPRPGAPMPPQGNHFFNQRFRIPNGRTSRAANLTAEEEKVMMSRSGDGAHHNAAGAEADHDGQSEQQALFLIQNLEESSPNEGELKSGEMPLESSPVVVQVAPVGEISPAEERKADGSEREEESGSSRQQRELNLENVLENGGAERSANGISFAVNLEEDMTAEESGIQAVNIFPGGKGKREDERNGVLSHPYQPISDVSIEAAISSESDKESDTGKDLKSSSKKLFGGQKGKGFRKASSANDVGKGSVSLWTSPSSPSPDKGKALGEKGIMKMKSAKGKIELEQFGKGKAKKESEQQEFVAPKVIQRGFHPILPYSEKDPGPIVVQIMPKVEKLLPPTGPLVSLKDAANRPENGHPLPTIPQFRANPPLILAGGGIHQNLLTGHGQIPLKNLLNNFV